MNEDINLCELLKGYEGYTFFHPSKGDVVVKEITNNYIKVAYSDGESNIPAKGKHSSGMGYLYPTVESFMENVFDPEIAWEIWLNDFTSSEERCLYPLEKCYTIDLSSWDIVEKCHGEFTGNIYNGNFFSTEKEAKEAKKEIKRTLIRFHRMKALKD